MNSYQSSEIDRFESDTTLCMITNPNNLDSLEKEWENYNLMPKDDRIRSDAKSMELFGKTNKERYEEMKSEYLKHDDFDIDDIPLEGGVIKEEVQDDHIEFEHIKYPDWAGEAAETWSLNAMRAIIRPVENLEKLEDLWRQYNDMHLKLRRESDWKSVELFGIDNKTHYEFLKSKFLKQDIKEEPPIPAVDGDLPVADKIDIDMPIASPIEEECRLIKYGNLSKLEAATKCLKLSNIKDATYCENILIQSTLKDSIELFKDDVANSSVFIDDLPWFSPDEMEHLGVFDRDSNRFSIEPDCDHLDSDVTVREWFNNYKALCSGVYTENTPRYTKLWISKLQELYLDYDRIKESGDTDKINARKQSILNLGWNPDFDFNLDNRLIAAKRIKDMYDKTRNCVDIIDISHFDPSKEFDSINEVELSNKNPLRPIFIVLVEGSSAFSAAVKSFTKGPFSHAAIGFDPKLDNLYSYNLKSTINGFSIENVNKYNKSKKLGVFSIFVKERDLRKIRKKLDFFIQNKDKTKYSFLNILTLPLNIPVEIDMQMICSQFVDRILKVADIDLTHTASSLVNPNTFLDAAKNNKKIYKLYEGKVGGYKPAKANRILNSIIGKAEYIKEFSNIQMNESAIIDYVCENSMDLSKLLSLEESIGEDINPITKELISYIIPQIECCALQEAKEFPVQFDDDGNLLIKSMNRIDFEAEYSKSHKLLVQYDKANDIESMKYELSRLWFMNSILEKRLHDTRYKSKKEEYNKVRARILNDFNKYLTIVMTKEESFNFAKYYEASPFSDAIYKLNKATLKYSGEALKHIIKGIVL